MELLRGCILVWSSLALSVHGTSVPVPAGYDASVPPSVHNESCGLIATPQPPTLVTAEWYVKKVHSVDQKSESFTIEGYFRLEWRDARLANQASCMGPFANTNGIWVPDVYIENALDFRLGSEGSRFQGEELRISAQGDVRWSQRAKFVMDCKMQCLGCGSNPGLSVLC